MNSISIIKQTVFGLFPDSKIILFGSHARQENTSQSDFDFLIVTKEEIDNIQKRKYKAQLRRELAKYKIPADILIESEKEIIIKKELSGHIIKEVVKEGVEL